MLLTLLILQALITQVLNQTHQQVVVEQKREVRNIPLVTESAIRRALAHDVDIKLLLSTPERQFFSAQFKICSDQQCDEFVQFFSVGSAILKEDIRFHAMRIL